MHIVFRTVHDQKLNRTMCSELFMNSAESHDDELVVNPYVFIFQVIRELYGRLFKMSKKVGTSFVYASFKQQ